MNEEYQDAVNAAENGPVVLGSSVCTGYKSLPCLQLLPAACADKSTASQLLESKEEELDIDVDDLDEDLLDELDEELTAKASLE